MLRVLFRLYRDATPRGRALTRIMLAPPIYGTMNTALLASSIDRDLAHSVSFVGAFIMLMFQLTQMIILWQVEVEAKARLELEVEVVKMVHELLDARDPHKQADALGRCENILRLLPPSQETPHE